MFGTVGRMRVKEGKLDDLLKLMEEWDRDRRSKVEGAIGSYLYKLDRDPSQVVLAVVFRDRQTYFKNADDPEQDQWYRRLVELLEGEPVWDDGEIVHGST